MEHTGRDDGTVERTVDRDHFLSAAEAKEVGIIDKVMEQRAGPESDAGAGKKD